MPAKKAPQTYRREEAVYSPQKASTLTAPKSGRPPFKGRGAVSNPAGRFEPLQRSFPNEESPAAPLDCDSYEEIERPKLKTEVTPEQSRSLITMNDSPDISFDRSINAYRGCEHGCIYCFARPSHGHIGLSSGLDFESKLVAKTNAPAVLERELSAKGYIVKTLAMGTNTDPYQPIDREYEITRQILSLLLRARHPVGIVTKSALVLRDFDLLAPMAEQGLVKVAISITTLDPPLARRLEPRASTPEQRLNVVKSLASAGIPVSVLVAPIIPAINDAEIETILSRARAMGAAEAGYVILRLPHELKDLFSEWLSIHYPGKANHVLSLVRSMRNGKLYESSWTKRMVGDGPYAWMIRRRFEMALDRLGFTKNKLRLRCDLFVPPKQPNEQLELF